MIYEYKGDGEAVLHVDKGTVIAYWNALMSDKEGYEKELFKFHDKGMNYFALVKKGSYDQEHRFESIMEQMALYANLAKVVEELLALEPLMKELGV